MISKVWKVLAGFGSHQPKTRATTPKPKRTRQGLIDLATSLGLEIRWDCYKKGSHAIFNSDGDAIHWRFGICDSPSNLWEIEQCLEEYKVH